MAPPAPRRPAPGGGLAVLVVITVLATLAAPHAQAVRGLVADALPAIAAPERPGARPASGFAASSGGGLRPAPAGQAVPLGAPKAPHAFDCSGLTWAAWRSAGVTIPRTAAGQLAGLASRPWPASARRPGDLPQPTARRGGMWRSWSAGVGWSRPGAAVSRFGRPGIRGGWLGAVRPGAGP